MPPTNPHLQPIANAAAGCLDDCMGKIRHCLDQLTEEQLWWRPAGDMNSIANLMLHLAGNIRQWIGAGLGGAEDHRDRPAEFATAGDRTAEQLLAQLQQAVDEAKQTLASLTPQQLETQKRIQMFDVNGAQMLFNAIPHFQGHTQEIICFTRLQLGERYRFQGIPPYPKGDA